MQKQQSQGSEPQRKGQLRGRAREQKAALGHNCRVLTVHIVPCGLHCEVDALVEAQTPQNKSDSKVRQE